MQRNTIWMILLFLVGVAFYILTLRGVAGSPTVNDIINKYDRLGTPFESSHERGPYVLVLSLVHNHSFGFDLQSAKAAHPDVGYHKNKFYIYFAPGVPLLIIPLFLIGQYFNLGLVFGYATIALISSLILVFLFAIARNTYKLPLWISLFVPMIYGFASTSWSYAGTIYQHQVSTFFIISGFYAVWKYKQKTKASVFWALYVWFAYAYAIFVDYPNAALMLPVMVYFLFSSINIYVKRHVSVLNLKRSFLITSCIFLLISGIHGYYNYINFGSPIRLSGSLPSYNSYLKRQNVKTPSEQVARKPSQKENIANFFSDDQLPNGVYELLFAVDKGLFVFSPIFVLAIFGIVAACMQITLETSIMLSVIIIDICLYASFSDPWGGWAYGPRYIIPSMAVLSVFIGIWLGKVAKKLYARVIVYLLFAVSGAIALLGSLTTNLIPPIVEAKPLHLSYTFLGNIPMLQNGITSNFIYTQYISGHISLLSYYIIIYELLIVIVYLILFILPIVKSYEH